MVVQIVLVFCRFLFDYFRARLQEPIGYQFTARDRLAVGDALKRVSLGYFGQVSTGNILSSITTGLSTLETMGIRMVDNFVGGYLNFIVVFLFLAVVSPLTALIALVAAFASFLFMTLISRYSQINAEKRKNEKNIKTIAIFRDFEYTICNRVARSLFDIGDQAETCAQLFYVKERFYGFEKTIDLR